MTNVKGENGSIPNLNRKQRIAEFFKCQKHNLDSFLRFKEKDSEETIDEEIQDYERDFEEVTSEIKQLLFMNNDDAAGIRKLYFQMAIRYAADPANDVTEEELMIMEGLHDVINAF